jgi:hypothetical protein
LTLAQEALDAFEGEPAVRCNWLTVRKSTQPIGLGRRTSSDAIFPVPVAFRCDQTTPYLFSCGSLAIRPVIEFANSFYA